MVVPESAVILPPMVGRVPCGGFPCTGEVVPSDDADAVDALVAPATPAPNPSTAAMVPPATTARPGVDQRQRARPRGWGRCAVVSVGSSWGEVSMVVLLSVCEAAICRHSHTALR